MGFFIVQKEHGSLKKRGVAGCQGGKNEMDQLVEADSGQQGIAELVQ